jgi:hypothetical protein
MLYSANEYLYQSQPSYSTVAYRMAGVEFRFNDTLNCIPLAAHLNLTSYEMLLKVTRTPEVGKSDCFRTVFIPICPSRISICTSLQAIRSFDWSASDFPGKSEPTDPSKPFLPFRFIIPTKMG